MQHAFSIGVPSSIPVGAVAGIIVALSVVLTLAIVTTFILLCIYYKRGR